MRRPSRILIVDDDPFTIDILAQELRLLGYEILSATNGREALKRIASQTPDLILLDVMMPIMDGFTACRLLREAEETRLLPIIIMTTLHAVEDRIKGIEAGANEFLTKPVNPRELRMRIQTMLNFKHIVDSKICEVHQIIDHYSKFVPEMVKRIVKENPAAPELSKRPQDCAVLFIDICKFTQLSQKLPMDDLNRLVEHYFSVYLDCIQKFGGDISETSGDGLMAIFHNKSPISHACLAAETALALLRETYILNKQGIGPPLNLHIGINCGTALVGSTRFEGLRSTRWIFTADGYMPNLAAHLSKVAKSGQILISQETAKRIKNRYPIKLISHRNLKKILNQIDIYCLMLP